MVILGEILLWNSLKVLFPKFVILLNSSLFSGYQDCDLVHGKDKKEFNNRLVVEFSTSCEETSARIASTVNPQLHKSDYNELL